MQPIIYFIVFISSLATFSHSFLLYPHIQIQYSLIHLSIFSTNIYWALLEFLYLTYPQLGWTDRLGRHKVYIFIQLQHVTHVTEM